jgi:hypothetical protein
MGATLVDVGGGGVGSRAGAKPGFDYRGRKKSHDIQFFSSVLVTTITNVQYNLKVNI